MQSHERSWTAGRALPRRSYLQLACTFCLGPFCLAAALHHSSLAGWVTHLSSREVLTTSHEPGAGFPALKGPDSSGRDGGHENHYKVMAFL